MSLNRLQRQIDGYRPGQQAGRGLLDKLTRLDRGRRKVLR